MRTVTMYWSNVCVLNKQEQRYIQLASEILKSQGVLLETEYFGLGYPHKLSHYLKETGQLPDIIVSTDLDLFEEDDFINRYQEQLLPLAGIIPIKEEVQRSPVCYSPYLLPLLVIPLVMVVNRDVWKEKVPHALADICDYPKAFGGRENAAGKGLIKQIRELYGQSFVDRFLQQAHIYDMPVQAFQAVNQGKVPVSIIPSIFAQRAFGKRMQIQYPAEGAVTVPSYIAVLNTLTATECKTILQTLFSQEFMDFFAMAGDVLPCFSGSKNPHLVEQNQFRLLYTPQ